MVDITAYFHSLVRYKFSLVLPVHIVNHVLYFFIFHPLTMSNDGGAVGPTEGSQHVLDMTIKSIQKDDSNPTSREESISMEKGQVVNTRAEELDDDLDAFSHEHPFPQLPDAEPETQQFTFRAVFVGCILGAVISASK